MPIRPPTTTRVAFCVGPSLTTSRPFNRVIENHDPDDAVASAVAQTSPQPAELGTRPGSPAKAPRMTKPAGRTSNRNPVTGSSGTATVAGAVDVGTGTVEPGCVVAGAE